MNPPQHPVAAPPPMARPTVLTVCSPFVRYVVDNAYQNVRPHQREAILVANSHFNAGHKIAQIVLPTGAGKTGVAVLLPYYMAASKVLVIAPFPALAVQLSHAFSGPTGAIPDRRDDAFLFKAGFDLIFANDIRQNSPERRTSYLPDHALALTAQMTPQLFNRELLIINREKIQLHTTLQIGHFPTNYDLVIVDEAHHYPAATWRRIVDHYRANETSKVLFLTATPNMDAETPPVPTIYNFTFQQAVNARAIRDIRFTLAGGQPGQELQSLMTLLKQQVARFDVEGRPMYQAMIAVRRGETGNAVELYNQGIVDPRERAEEFVQGTNDQVLTRFKNHEFRTMIVYQRLLEGFDHPNVAFVVVARQMSPRTFNQFVGRATRIDDGVVPVAQVFSHQVFDQERNYHAMRGGDWQIAQEGEVDEDPEA